MADERLIAALDVSTRAEAEKLVTQLGERVGYYKVGMELFYALGGDIVTWLKGRERRSFSTSSSMIFQILWGTGFAHCCGCVPTS